ncbi:hemerythrin domain-containing protein [Aestuariicoccus sp. MJ-SS9]|uniref:hemerythrin domain-containing protein n=1 Tax=Aestuariicoccus sp. MJ-SS9 TaxID=3079855 RepID=UPI00290881F0|nr:hemerythrin domain-containing protein [Aestuariicoccus sp. MJ-SS9]MDU8911796.1 hemerythrin domain-containing protein [Aestuariicoccus sp. MJ-SS9]
MTDLSLDTRTGLPDALRVLLADFPREMWDTHPHFAGLVQFWLDRHMMFRRLMEALQADAEAAVDRKLDAPSHQARLARYGGMLVNQLHGHHQIEDMHYFPVLSGMETRLARGFEILDHDHHALDDVLERFTKTANGLLQGKVEAGVLREELTGFNRFLDRHLIDEEELIVPVILKHGPDRLG